MKQQGKPSATAGQDRRANVNVGVRFLGEGETRTIPNEVQAAQEAAFVRSIVKEAIETSDRQFERLFARVRTLEGEVALLTRERNEAFEREAKRRLQITDPNSNPKDCRAYGVSELSTLGGLAKAL